MTLGGQEPREIRSYRALFRMRENTRLSMMNCKGLKNSYSSKERNCWRR